MVEKAKELRSTDWWLQNKIHSYSVGNTVNNVVVDMCGARWELEISRETLCKVYDYLTTMLYT